MRYFKSRPFIGALLIVPVLTTVIVVGSLRGAFGPSTSTEAAPVVQVAGQSVGLNPECVVSILNRTANVGADGSWRIRNVPANLGLVRVRATCVRDGQTISGQSEFFTITANTINGFNGDIPLGIAAPIPVSIDVVADTNILTAIGDTAQLTVIATLPDGSTKDMTSSEDGTNYISTNPTIATVDANGLVTAQSSGAVAVSALNQGALGLLTLQVVLAGDSDGDGIPDDVELANGLDPNNPVDGLEDFDGDGLSNKEELVDFGSDPRDPDTDGDGIADGEEVVREKTGSSPVRWWPILTVMKFVTASRFSSGPIRRSLTF